MEYSRMQASRTELHLAFPHNYPTTYTNLKRSHTLFLNEIIASLSMILFNSL
jgi:hypothetical protein